MLLLTLLKAARSETLSYLVQICVANGPRGRMQVDPQTVSSHGFLYALYRAALRIADPFIEGYSKLAMVDPDQFFRDPQWASFVREQTRIIADQTAADDYAASLGQGSYAPHFISSAFHVALALAHLGPLSTVRTYGGQIRDIQEVSRAVARMRRERDAAPEGPGRALGEAMLRRFEGQLDTMIGEKLASDTALLDPEFLRHVLKFVNFQIVHLLRVAVESCGGKTMGVNWATVVRGEVTQVGGVDLERLDEPDGRWKSLPEWLVDDVCEWYSFITR